MAKDGKEGGFVHVVLTPCVDENGEFGMEICQAEPIGPEEAQRLTELFAKINAEQERGGDCFGHGFETCPICTPVQREQVASAVQRAMRRKRRPDA